MTLQLTKTLLVLLSTAFLMTPRIHSAQSVRDMVNTTVEEGLEKEKKKKGEPTSKPSTQTKPQPATQPKAPASLPPSKSPNPDEEPGGDQDSTDPPLVSLRWDSSAPPPEVPLGEKLPRRILHEYIQLDPSVGVGYRGWIPQQYPTVKSDMTGYVTWSVDIKGRFFKLVSLKRGYYESNGASAPRHPYRSDAAKYGSYGMKAAWFLLELGIPIARAWEPSIGYETRAFHTNARTTGDHQVCIVPFDSSADDPCTNYTTRFSMVSAMETAYLGMTYYPSKNPSPVVEEQRGKKPPFFFGLGYLSYAKPYQVTIGSTVLEELLFTGRFYGGGLALGTRLGGGVNRPFFRIFTQFGLGASRLTRDLTLNEAAPSDWMIGYLQGTMSFSFRWAPFKSKPTLLIVPSAEVSGASFFFFEKKGIQQDDFVMPNTNRDFLYSAKLSFILPL